VGREQIACAPNQSCRCNCSVDPGFFGREASAPTDGVGIPIVAIGVAGCSWIVRVRTVIWTLRAYCDGNRLCLNVAALRARIVIHGPVVLDDDPTGNHARFRRSCRRRFSMASRLAVLIVAGRKITGGRRNRRGGGIPDYGSTEPFPIASHKMTCCDVACARADVAAGASVEFCTSRHFAAMR